MSRELTQTDRSFMRLYLAAADILFSYRQISGHFEALKRLKEAQEYAHESYQSLMQSPKFVLSIPTSGITS